MLSPRRSKSVSLKNTNKSDDVETTDKSINPELLVALVRNKQNTETQVRAKLTTENKIQSKPVERKPSKKSKVVRGWSYHCEEPKNVDLEDLEENAVDDNQNNYYGDYSLNFAKNYYGSKTSNSYENEENSNSLESLKQEPEIDLLKGIELELQKLKEENKRFFENQRKKSDDIKIQQNPPITKSTSQSSGFYEIAYNNSSSVAPVAKPRKFHETAKTVKVKRVDSKKSMRRADSVKIIDNNRSGSNKVVKRNSTSAKKPKNNNNDNTPKQVADRNVFSTSSTCLVNEDDLLNKKSNTDKKSLNKETITALSERLTAAVSEQLREQLERLDSTREIGSITELADKMDIQVNILPKDDEKSAAICSTNTTQANNYDDNYLDCVGEKVKTTRTVRKLKKVKKSKKDKKEKTTDKTASSAAVTNRSSVPESLKQAKND